MRRTAFVFVILLLIANSVFAQRLKVGLKFGLDSRNSGVNYVYTYKGIAQIYGINQWTSRVWQLPSPTVLIELNDRISLELSTQFNFFESYSLTSEDDHYSFFNQYGSMIPLLGYTPPTSSVSSSSGRWKFHNFEVGLSQKTQIISYKKKKIGVIIGLDYSFPLNVSEKTTQPLSDDEYHSTEDTDRHYLNSNFTKDHLLNWSGYLSAKIGTYISSGPVSFDISWGQSLFSPEKSDNPFFRSISSFEMMFSVYLFNRPFKFQKPNKVETVKSTVKKRLNYFSLEVFQPMFSNSNVVGTGGYFSENISISNLVSIYEKPDYKNYTGLGIGFNQHLKHDWWLKHTFKINIIKETYKNYQYDNVDLVFEDNIQSIFRIDLSSGVRRRVLKIKKTSIELEAGLNLDFFTRLPGDQGDELVLNRNLLNLSPYYQTCFLWKEVRFSLGYMHSLFPLFQEHGGVNFENFRNAYLGLSIPLSLLKKE